MPLRHAFVALRYYGHIADITPLILSFHFTIFFDTPIVASRFTPFTTLRIRLFLRPRHCITLQIFIFLASFLHIHYVFYEIFLASHFHLLRLYISLRYYITP